MNRAEILNLLREHKPTLKQRFGVIELAIFGSFARDEASSDSDVDILVRFGKPPPLEAVLWRPVLPGRTAWLSRGHGNSPGVERGDQAFR